MGRWTDDEGSPSQAGTSWVVLLGGGTSPQNQRGKQLRACLRAMMDHQWPARPQPHQPLARSNDPASPRSRFATSALRNKRWRATSLLFSPRRWAKHIRILSSTKSAQSSRVFPIDLVELLDFTHPGQCYPARFPGSTPFLAMARNSVSGGPMVVNQEAQAEDFQLTPKE